MCWGCLRFLFRPSFAAVRCSDIYRDSHLGALGPMLRFGDCRGVQLLRMGRLVYSLLTMKIWATRRQGWRRSSGLAWNGLLPFGEYMASSGLLRLYGFIPRSCSTLPLLAFHFSYCLTRARSSVWATVSADFLYLLFCFFAGRWSYLMALYRDLSYSSRVCTVYSP